MWLRNAELVSCTDLQDSLTAMVNLVMQIFSYQTFSQPAGSP